MPIEVRHGGQGGTAAGQILAQVLQQVAARKQQEDALILQLNQQSNMQQQAFKQQGNMQRSALDAQTQQRDFEQEQQTKNLQLKAQMDAEIFDKRYTSKQQAEIAHWKSVPEKARQSGMYNEDQLRRITENAKMHEMGIMPQDMPRLSKYERGKEEGKSWEENGARFWNDRGTIRQVDVNKTPEGLSQKQELEALKEKAKLEAEERRDRTKYRIELSKMQVPDSNSPSGLGYLSQDQIEERMQAAFPSAPDPKRIENAKRYLSTMIKKWKSSPPPEVAQAMLEAQDYLRKTQGAM